MVFMAQIDPSSKQFTTDEVDNVFFLKTTFNDRPVARTNRFE